MTPLSPFLSPHVKAWGQVPTHTVGEQEGAFFQCWQMSFPGT